MGKFTGVAPAMAGIMDRNYTRQYEDRKRMEEQQRQDQKRKEQQDAIRQGLMGFYGGIPELSDQIKNVPGEAVGSMVPLYESRAKEIGTQRLGAETRQRKNEGMRFVLNTLEQGLGDKTFANPNVELDDNALDVIKKFIDKNADARKLAEANQWAQQQYGVTAPSMSLLADAIDNKQQGVRDIAENTRSINRANADRIADTEAAKELKRFEQDYVGIIDINKLSDYGKEIMAEGERMLQEDSSEEGIALFYESLNKGELDNLLLETTPSEENAIRRALKRRALRMKNTPRQKIQSTSKFKPQFVPGALGGSIMPVEK